MILLIDHHDVTELPQVGTPGLRIRCGASGGGCNRQRDTHHTYQTMHYLNSLVPRIIGSHPAAPRASSIGPHHCESTPHGVFPLITDSVKSRVIHPLIPTCRVKHPRATKLRYPRSAGA